MTAVRFVWRAAAAVLVAGALALGVPLGAQAATYPPATTGTFSVTAHPGANRITVDGLGADKEATALIAGSGPAPTLGVFAASTANLRLGRTDAAGSVTFTLVFAPASSGFYNVSVSTPDGHSVSGAIAVPSRDGGPLAWTGTNIAAWVLWAAGVLIVIGIVVLVTTTVARRRSRR